MGKVRWFNLNFDTIFFCPRVQNNCFGVWTGSYLARPLEEVKVASYEEKVQALKCAEKLQSNLQSENPFFIKTMVRSHVYSCFWLVSCHRLWLQELISTISMSVERSNLQNDHLASPGLHET